MHEPGTLSRQTADHLRRLGVELRAEPVPLNGKGEASIALEHAGHAQELTLAVAESLDVVAFSSFVASLLDERRVDQLALMVTTLNLSVADTGGMAFAVLPTTGELYATYGLIGSVPYEQFRAVFARLVEVTSAWKSRIASDAELTRFLQVTR